MSAPTAARRDRGAERKPLLHLVPATPFGGAQRLAVDLAAAQRAGGADARLLLLNPGRHTAAAAAVAGVPAEDVGTGLGRIAATRRAVRGAGLVHLHLPPPWIAAALPKGVPVVLHLHVRPALVVRGRTPRRRLDALGERLVLARADRLIAISDWVAAAWHAAHPAAARPVDVVYNGIALPAGRARPRSDTGRPFTVAMACRLSDRKGVEEFVALAAALHAAAPDICLRIAGDGPLRAAYEATARAAGLGAALAFEGFVSDIAAFWAEADLAAFTPPFEPFGLRLIEPVAHGVPVLAYANGSGSDEVIERCRGVLAVPYGDIAAWVAAALALRAAPDRLAAMAEAGRADVAAHFSLAAMAAGVAATYRLAGAKPYGASAETPR